MPSPSPLLGIYVHVPFCQRRCRYCDFYTLAQPPAPDFVDALLAELRGRQDEIRPPRPAHSLYLGGGTPSLLRDAELSRLIAACRHSPGLEDDAEITLEANPASLGDAGGRRRAGCNRLSLGLQSLDDRWLGVLGRLHDAETARAAVREARAAGFTELSVDLILAVPGQSLTDSRADVSALAELGAEHISAYLLSVEPGTPLAETIEAGELQAVDDELATDMLEQAEQVLATHGYQRYEISSFARPGHRARHNSLYWSGGEYLGLGPGAHSHWRERGGGRRRSNPADLQAYLRHHTANGSGAWQSLEHVDEWLPPDRFVLERLYLGLRDLDRGVDLIAVLAEAGMRAWPELSAQLEKLRQQGQLERLDQRWRLRPSSANLADAVARDLLAVVAPGDAAKL